MKSNSQSSRTATSVRRVLPAIAIAAVAVSLAACQTPPQATTAAAVHVVSAPKPAAIHLPTWTDRITAQLEHDAQTKAVSQEPLFAASVRGLQLVLDDPPVVPAAHAKTGSTRELVV